MSFLLKTLTLTSALLAAPGAFAHQPIFVANLSDQTVLLQANPKSLQINLLLTYFDEKAKTIKRYPVSPATAFNLRKNVMVTIEAQDDRNVGQGSFQIVYPAGSEQFNRDEFTYQADPLDLDKEGSGEFDLAFLPFHSALDGTLYAEKITDRCIAVFRNPVKAAVEKKGTGAGSGPGAGGGLVMQKGRKN